MKFYEEIKIEIVVLSAADIVTISENGLDDTWDDIFKQ